MKSKLISTAVFVAATILGGAGAFAQSQPTGSWGAEASGYQFTGGASATDGTYLYLFGGNQYGVSYYWPEYYESTVRYDPVTNSWAILSFMPDPCTQNTGAYYNGRIYSFGNEYYASGSIYSYDIAANQWTPVAASLTANRFYAAAATLGDRIYIAGGGYYGAGNRTDEFNPTTGSITTRANLPASLYLHTMAAVPSLNKVYVIGGYNNGNLATCYEYSPTDNAWTTKSPISVNSQLRPRQAPRAFTINTRIYVTGGYDNNGYTLTNFEYNAATDSWAQRANMAYLRFFHAAAAINGKGYVYGGEPYYYYGEEFSPPNFGSSPNPPANVAQAGSKADSSLQSQADASIPDGWTNSQVSFSASVTDPDAGQQVRFRVRVKDVTASTWTNLDSGFQFQGLITIPWTAPANGAYDWQYRVEDTYGNSFPAAPNAWAEAFDNAASPDFRSDQVPPADPLAISPSNVDVVVDHPVSGKAILRWTESTDNGPVTGITYEIQVARDGAFIDVESQIFSSAGTSSFPVELTVARTNKFWRLRARDVGGNYSAWSNPLSFRVVYDDKLDHGAGDTKKSCGFGAGAPAAPGALLLCLLALAAMAVRRGVRRV